jgi:hypothetical protein
MKKGKTMKRHFCKVQDGRCSNFTTDISVIKDNHKNGYFEIMYPEVDDESPTQQFLGWEYKFKRTYVQAKPIFSPRQEADKLRLLRKHELENTPIKVRYTPELHTTPSTENQTMLMCIILAASNDTEKGNYPFEEGVLGITRDQAKEVLRAIAIRRHQLLNLEPKFS